MVSRMASAFLDTFQNLANSITINDNENGFTWDSAIRKFQYGVAGITLAALSIFETTNSMKCSTPGSSSPEYSYASSYCQEATWYYVSNSTGGREPYDEFLRYFKWYILIPPVFTIVVAALYGALVDSHIVQALKCASRINDLLSSSMEDTSTVEGMACIDKTVLNMAVCSRAFSETNMHYKRKGPWYKSCGKSKSTLVTIEEGENTELCERNNSILIDQANKAVATTADRLGQNSAFYFNAYLLLVFLINFLACLFLNPIHFWFPSAIACKYRVEDLTFHWSICSVPGHSYSRAAVIFIMLNHAMAALVSLLSLYYLNVYIPKAILTADMAIESYTRQPKMQAKLHHCWLKYGHKKVKNLTSTSKFILALIYQNICRTLCFRLVLALIDIEKDIDNIECELPTLIKDIVSLDQSNPCIFNDDKEEKIDEIRDTILHPCGIDQVRDNIRSRILVNVVENFLNDPSGSRHELFEAQQIQRITGVQLPKLSREAKEKFELVIKEAKETDFTTPKEYYNFIAALFDVSKSNSIVAMLQPIEIGQIYDDEFAGTITDNGHVTIKDQPFSALKAFDASGYCWRSCDATSYNWIRRTWDQKYSIKLIAIQGSHVDEESTPIRFNFTAKIVNKNGKENWAVISETYRSYDWMKDEWRFFSVRDLEKCTHPFTDSIQMNILNNGGASFIEVQKIRIYGTSEDETELKVLSKNAC